MSINNIKLAEDYYQKMLQKDFVAMADCLHEDVHLISPLSEVFGRENVVNAATNLSEILQNIIFNAKFESDSQVMFAYDFIFAEPIGKLRSACLIDFEEGLIVKINLFYDGRPFITKKDEIFSQ